MRGIFLVAEEMSAFQEGLCFMKFYLFIYVFIYLFIYLFICRYA
jgi:hypothetical protein